MKPSRGFLLTLTIVLIGGLAAALATWHYDRTLASELESQLYIAPEVELTPEMRWLQEYVRIDTTNPPGNETRGAELLARILSENGIESEIIEPAQGRGSLYARIEGRRSDETLLLIHHIDVVAAEAEHWRYPPFSGEVRQGYLWGRGTLDMKGIGIAHLAAFIELSRGAVPERDVVFLAVADEEKGSAMGLRWLLENRPEIFDGVTACLNEGGITEMVGGEVLYFGIETGSMVMSRWEVAAPARREIEKARIALEPFIQPLESVAIEPMIEEYYSGVASHRIVYGDQLRDIRGAIERGDYFRVGDEYRARMEVRARVMPIEQSNGGWRMPFFVFSPPSVPFPRVEGAIRDAIAPGHLRLIGVEPSAPYSPTDTELFATISRNVAKTFGPPTVIGPYTTDTVITDSRFLRARGINCYGFWPFPVDFFLSRTLHSSDERVRLDYFATGVALMKKIVTDYAG